MYEPARGRIARSQAALVRALAAGEDAPEGFDGFRLQEAAGALFSKRARSVAQAWPELSGALGQDYMEHFRQYAMKRMLPEAGPVADGRAFALALKKRGLLIEQARMELFAFDMRHRVRGGRVTKRRFFFGAIFSRRPLRATVALRLPVLGERWFRLGS